MEYERYHLVSLFKEVAKNASTQLVIISFLKEKKKNSKMISKSMKYDNRVKCLLTECSHSLKLVTVKI